MVNFRFHLVSLTAVFLALAAGIAIGAGVVDRATVDRIERQLDDVEANRRRTNAQNDRLKEDLARWERFAEEAGDRLVAGRLEGAGVVVVAVAGVDRALVERFTTTLRAAGATVEGTLWLTGKWALTEQEDVRQLAAVLDAGPGIRGDELRRAGALRIAGELATPERSGLLAELGDAAFVELDPPPGGEAAPAGLPAPGSLVVVVSSESAEVASDELAHPLVADLSSAGLRVMAAQPAPAGAGTTPGVEPPTFARGLRADGDVAPRVSTVDNLDDYRGRVAAVLALDRLRAGRTGHYGVAPGADRLLPEAGP